MNQAGPRLDTAWRKSRLAARLLIRKEAGRMSPRDKALARRLSQDPEVSDRLIQQGLYYLWQIYIEDPRALGSSKH